MIIVLADHLKGPDEHFAVYHYDESMVNSPYCIDVRSIVQKNLQPWLDDLETSHIALSKAISKISRWWWVTPMSRLDARPWGQEYVIKPLFFARGLVDWIEANAHVQRIVLVGCEPSVITYLKEFAPQIKVIDQGKKPFLYQWLDPIIQLGAAALKTLDQFLYFARRHTFARSQLKRREVLVLYESVEGSHLRSGHEHYYGDLFNDPDLSHKIMYLCVTNRSTPIGRLRNEQKDIPDAGIFFDAANLFFVLRSFLVNIYIICIAVFTAIKKNSCQIGERRSYHFWFQFIAHELNRSPSLPNILSYYILEKIIKKVRPQIIIFPYEEKGIERAFEFAADGSNVKTIGYLPHPQHWLTLALRAKKDLNYPQPKQYAVCGSLYTDHLKLWAGKDPSQIHVWGSGKPKQKNSLKVLSRGPFKVLFLISHFNELKVFGSWLKANPELTQNTQYDVRLYQALKNKTLSEELSDLMSHFNCVHKAQDDWDHALCQCDVALFCGTSAGLIAARNGVLSIHAALDDFFPMNPCFDQLDVFLSCANSDELLRCLENIRGWTAPQREAAVQRQKKLVKEIFSDKNAQIIREDLCAATIKIQ